MQSSYGIPVNATMNVKRLLLREVLEQQSQTITPYASSYTAEERNKFDEITRGGALIDQNSLSGIANAILRPNARAAATARVENGWTTRRFYFWMEMDIQRNANSVNTEIVSGFTDYLGASMQTASIDPQLKFYVNNHMVVNQVLSVTGAGNASSWVPMVSANNQVIVPTVLDGASTQRPTDLFTGPLIESSVTEIMSNAGAVAAPTLISGEQVKLSRRDNLTPGAFLANTLQSQRQARLTSSFMGAEDDMAVLSGAATRTNEHDAAASPILRNLMQESDFLRNGFFTYGELLGMDSTGNLDTRVEVVFNKAETVWDSFSAENTQHWNGGDHTTMVSKKLAVQFTKLALDNLCTGFEFTATNATPNGVMTVVITNMHLFSNSLPGEVYLDRISAGLEALLLAESFLMPMSTIQMRASVNPFGTTRMFTSIDGEPEVPYMLATFSDSVISAIVNPSMEAVMTLSSDLRGLSAITDHNFTSNYGQDPTQQMTNVMGTPGNYAAQQPASGPMQSNPGWALDVGGKPGLSF